MKYTNPIVKGFYPDPSVCFANGMYYMVCSSFQYFPGVPLFESSDLVNWKQIGHCFTRKNQVMLDKIESSGGVFAATIRYNNGRFYVVTTNATTHQNFYVWTDDIRSEWSDPIFVAQDGIDPSLYFEDGRTYFLSNGTDDEGNGGVVQCEINIETGEKLSASKVIWKGSGGRFLESPHMYKINGDYYLMAAEGGTEYGHMITYARSNSIWGEFVGYPKNPVLTNRNLGGQILQGMGHGDLVQNPGGDWFIIHLGFRQAGNWAPYHHLGREVFMTPVTFGEDGWFTAGTDGTTAASYEINGDFVQEVKELYTFENTRWDIDWCFLRHPHEENYQLSDNSVKLTGTDITLDMADSPTFIGIRQRDFRADISCDVTASGGEGGITVYMDENHHYDLAVRPSDTGYEAVLKLNIGDIKHVQSIAPISSDSAKLIVRTENHCCSFFVSENGSESYLGSAQTKYLSPEIASPFTGVIIGLYAVGNGSSAVFTDFSCRYS
ncbi:MAG: glycoside hydrolase family 43 protein, partial [Ruminococcus sp.]|nr:glycoside hydrolase family 43 protein [Ruminococcus sp.]